MCWLSAAFSKLSQERDEFTKKLVSLKSGLKGKEAISEMKGLGEIKGKVVLCAQGVKDKTKKVLSKKIY